MSRLGLGLGLTKGGVIPFNPLSLDPYLLFDTQSSMIGTFENPTLDLDPSVPSSLDIITATRAGTATVTDASGNIVDAAPNTVRVDHVQGELITAARTNLMGYSEPTLAQYTAVGSGISGVVITDSGLTQWTQWGDTAGSYRAAQQNITLVVGQTYVFSFYIRMNDGGAPVVGTSGAGASTDLAIHIETSSAAGTAGGIENVGSGLYRVWGKRTATSTSGNVHIIKWVNQSARGFRVSGLQVEQATAPTALIDNDTGAPITDPAVYGPRVPMILVEPSATNLVPSKVFTALGTTTIASGFLAPDGSMDAYEVSNILDASGDRVYCAGATVSGSTEYTGSLYVKGTAGEVASFYAKRNNGAISTSTTSVVTLTGSWQRVTGLTFTTAADNTQAVVAVRKYGTTTTADTIQIWGAQLELGPVSTSFIKTTSGAVTRAADDYKIVGTDFTDFYNQSEGTVYLEAQKRDAGSIYNFTIGDGTLNNRIISTHNAIFMAQSNSAQVSISYSLPSNSLYRIALSVKNNDTKTSISGANEISDTSCTLPTANGITLGGRQDDAAAQKLNGHIKRMIYWPYHSDSL